MKIQKCLQKILILLVFLIAANGAKAQTLNFILSKDTINTSDLLTITNTSTGFNSNSRFYWEFETCDFYINDTTVICNTTTTGISQNITGKFYHDCYCLITLKALDSLGNVITTIPFSYKTIYVQLLNQLICETVSCHDPMPWNACEYICNGDFEWYNPLCIDDQGQLCIAEPWQISHQGNMPGSSPDYFNSCFTGPCPGGVPPNAMCMDVPANYHSQNQPSCGGGNGYAGFIAISGTSANDQQREYIQQPLKYSLIPGNTYHIKMYLSHDGRSDLACNKIKLYFSNGQPVQAPWGLFPNVIQNQLTSPSVLMTNHTWTQYSADFVAPTGTNLNWVSIGVFDQFSQINITTGNHETYYNTHPPVFSRVAYYFIDSISIKYAPIITATAFPTSICNSGCTNLSASGASTYTWMPGNLTGSTVNVCPTTTTTYTVIGTSASGCTGSATITVQVVAPPQKPIIIGNHNSCDTIAAYYTISNFNLNNTYFWRIGDDNYSGSFPQYGSSIIVAWNPLYTIATAEYTWLYVEVTDNNTGCTSEDSIKIWKCCRKNEQSLAFNDTIITSAGIFSVWPPPVFNGNVIVNQNISVNNIDYILMGPEAKIIVNPQYTFTITASSIGAGCGYMWDGIYVTDSNAKVIIQNNLIIASNVYDAKNAIVSENGGKFELKYSKFYNNYISVLAKNNFWGPYLYPFTGYPHKGIIKGCTFANNGTGMIAPYLGQKTRYGIYADNADRLTVGDSTFAGNTNTFRNLYCGVYSKNSTIKLINNDFRRIKNTLPCFFPSPEIFTTQYCETAIFSIYYNPDNLEHINGSVLTCGGNSTTTRNTFDTCNMAIYTYQTTTKLTKNKIYNTGTGIKCRDVRNPSYITHSIFKTNTPIGIQVIRTVPSYTNLTVMYDTILDPTYGIYLSNIKSHATVATLKSVVRNNYVTLNGTGSLYGIRLENSNYINAYCNKVKRSTLVPVADSLKRIGIQLEHCANAYIHDNSFSKLSLGIKGSGDLTKAKLKMNNIDSCYHGFYFATAYSGNGTVLTEQGTAYWPFDNKFSEYPGKPIEYRYGGALPGSISINWWYKNPPLYYKISIPPGHPLNQRISPQLTTGNDTAVNCGSQPQGLMGSGTSGSGISNSSGTSTDAQALDFAFNESYSFGEINEPMKYILQDNAYSILSNMEQQPTLGNSALRQQYSAVYSQMTSGNIGKFSRVLSLVDAGQIADARSVNAGIAPTNDIESNKQFAYSVYFDYVVPQLEIPAAKVEQLQIIADTPPCIGGGGVYVARAILGYTELETVNNKNLASNSDEIEGTETSGTIVIYPNPTSDELFILFDGYENGQHVDVELYNMLGTLMLNKQIVSSTEALNISTEKIPGGCYILILKTASNALYKNHLVIIK